MKSPFRLTVGCLLTACLLAFTTPVAPRAASVASPSARDEQQGAARNVQIKRGAEVAARVKSLRETSKNVRAALREFEKRGRSPKIDEAVTISGNVGSTNVAAASAPRNDSLFQKASFVAARQQQTTMRENGIELTFVTSLDLPDEWQGTVIARRYDDYGNLLDEYVSDVVLTAPSYDHTQWTARYETSFVDGAPYLMHQPGMFTGFSLGTSVQDHQTYFGAPPPTDIETWQFGTDEIQQQYYESYPSQWRYQTPQEKQQYNERFGPMMMDQQISRRGGAVFKPAVYRAEAGGRGLSFKAAAFQVRSDRSATREELRAFCGNPNGCGPSVGQVLAPYTPRLRSWAIDTGARCAATAGGCGLASAIFAEVTWGPCFVAGCTGNAIYNAGRHIFRLY